MPIKQDLSTPADLSLGSWEPATVSPAKGKETQAPSTVRTSTAPTSDARPCPAFYVQAKAAQRVEYHFASKAEFLTSLTDEHESEGIAHDRSASGGVDSSVDQRGGSPLDDRGRPGPAVHVGGVDDRELDEEGLEHDREPGGGADLSDHRDLLDPVGDRAGAASDLGRIAPAALASGTEGQVGGEPTTADQPRAADQLWGEAPPTFCYLSGAAGCLSGETVVEYNRGARNGGRSIALKEFFRKFNGLPTSHPPAWDLTLPTFIQSVDDNGVMFYNRVVAAYESGVKACVRLEVYGEQGIRATPDHRFLTANGYVAVGDLKIGDKVICRGSMRAQSNGGRHTWAPRVIVNTKYHPYGAYKNVDGYEYMRVARARLVVEAHLNEVPYEEFIHALKHNQVLSATFRFIPTDFEVHHDDENSLNDDLGNLVVMSKAEHARLHNMKGNFRFDSIEERAVTDLRSGEEEMTYDLQMESPANNFCANTLVVHNCGKTWLASQWAGEVEGLELLATTGIASINLGGTTINAYLGYFDTRSLQENYTTGFLSTRLRRLWRAGLRRLVVDEVSMMDGDQLGFLKRAIDEVNGHDYQLDASGDVDDDLPELGLTVVGDFAQLPPVNAPFAFESPEWKAFSENTITLTTVRRQADAGFIEALRAARRGDGRAVRDFFAGKLSRVTDAAFQGSTLFAKNDAVDRYNWIRMSKLTGSEILFMNLREGEQRSEWGNPKKPAHTWGIPPRLVLKPGALVMVLANFRLPLGKGFVYVNGDLGIVEDADMANNVCQVKLHRTGTVVPVQYVRREKKAPCDSARRRELRALGLEHTISEDGKWEITGWVSYMPLRVAYGSTVHKSQGLSLDAVQVNISDPFFKTPGMLYVAFSRARTAEGLKIVGTEAALIERCTVNPKLKGYL